MRDMMYRLDVGYHDPVDLTTRWGVAVKCPSEEVVFGSCPFLPSPDAETKFNPCVAAEVKVAVSNDGLKFSDDGIDYPHSSISNVDNHLDYTVSPTYALFTFVRSEYYNHTLLEKNASTCLRPTVDPVSQEVVEEGVRFEESGWFRMAGMSLARIELDWGHIPPDMRYGEHYHLAIFIRPSRCDDERCNGRTRVAPKEVVPCRRPIELPAWFLDEKTPKQQSLNLTVTALDDVLMKIEVHIVHGLFVSTAPFFVNTTTVHISKPSRALVAKHMATPEDKWGPEYPLLRQLGPEVSYTEKFVPMDYFFVSVFSYESTNDVASPLNLPPR